MSNTDKIPRKLDPTERTPNAVGQQLLEQFVHIVTASMQQHGWQAVDLARRVHRHGESIAHCAARVEGILSSESDGRNALLRLQELADILHALGIQVRIEEI